MIMAMFFLLIIYLVLAFCVLFFIGRRRLVTGHEGHGKGYMHIHEEPGASGNLMARYEQRSSFQQTEVWNRGDLSMCFSL